MEVLLEGSSLNVTHFALAEKNVSGTLYVDDFTIQYLYFHLWNDAQKDECKLQ